MTTTDVDAAPAGRAWIVPASAVAFAVLFVAGLLAVGNHDTKNQTAEQVLKDFHDGKGAAVVSGWLLVLAGLAFIPLAWGASRRVSAGLSELGEHVARTAALLFVAMVLVSAALFATLAATVVFGLENDPPVDLLRFVPQIGFPILFIAGALSVGLFLAVVSRAGQKASAVPTWFSVLGYVAAVAMLGGAFFIPMLLLPIWALAAANVLRH